MLILRVAYVILQIHLFAHIFEQIVMNPKNYPIETRTVWESSDDSSWEYCWRGVSLCHRDLWCLQEQLSWELNLALVRYPDAPFPVATRNFQRVGLEKVRWNYAYICFIQSQARKIQKCWVANRPTEVM